MKRNQSSTKPGPDEPGIETLSIKDLIPHPDQEIYFPFDPHTHAVLVESIAAEGVKTPLDVLPEGNAAGLPANTIVAGHGRAKAAKKAGLKNVPVKMRHDLHGATRAKIDEVFLKDNVFRRHMSLLAKVRAAAGIYRARRHLRGKEAGKTIPASKGFRDKVGAIIGMTGRNVERYLNILETPAIVQRFFEESHIKLVDAERVKKLPVDQQEELAQRLVNGDKPKAVFADFFPGKGKEGFHASNAVAALSRSLMAAKTALLPCMDEIQAKHVEQHAKALRGSRRLITKLLAKLEETK